MLTLLLTPMAYTAIGLAFTLLLLATLIVMVTRQFRSGTRPLI